MRSHAFMRIKKQLAESAKVRKVPLLGHFELTARCNLDCKMCYVHTQDNKTALRKELTTEQWKKIFDEAYDNEMLYANLSGGECLLRNDFKELYLHLFNKRVMVSVLTNGTLINEDYVEFFKKYRPEMIQISLYGSNEDGYLRVTGHHGFEKAVSAIKALENAGIDVRVAITPSKYMLDDYINIVRICKENNFFLTSSEMLLISNRECPEKNDYYLDMDEIVLLTKERAMIERELSPVATTPEPQGPMFKPAKQGWNCNAGSCLAAVTWEGKMYPCINAMVGGADVLTLGYAEAWKQTVQAASQLVQPVECAGCAYEKTCPRCPVHRLTDLHSGHCNPSVCEMTRKLVAAGVKKLDQKAESCEE